MKTIDIPVQVPDWTTHIAMDSDGCWSAYADKPNDDGVMWLSDGHSEHLFCLPGDHYPNWRETLREVA